MLRKRQEVEVVHKQQPEVVLVLHRRQQEVVLDLAHKAPKSEPDRTIRPEAVRSPQQVVRNPQPMADRTAEQVGQEEADRYTHPAEAVHTHHLAAAVDTGSAEEGAHRARIPVERDKQDRSRNTLVASSLHSGCKVVGEQEEGGRRMRVVEGIADYSLDTT